ncbi:MAG: 50S ribosomal protein L9 [Bdellovibrionales bacterium]|nr:50S ribosomal protein L9 [Bdellovibrionales bacterium]
MKVIVLKSTNNVGMVGDIVDVKPGFARNYLFPQNRAVHADSTNMKRFEHQKKMLEKQIEKAREESKSLQEKINGKEITIVRKSAVSKKLFGSVTSLDIQKALMEEYEHEINRKSIVLSEPIKQIGEYQIPLKLDGGLQASIKVIVEADSSEADQLAAQIQEANAAEDRQAKAAAKQSKENSEEGSDQTAQEPAVKAEEVTE